jgi:hypothetical protein
MIKVNLESFFVVTDKSGLPSWAVKTESEAQELCSELEEIPGWFDWDYPSYQEVAKGELQEPDDKGSGWGDILWGNLATQRP